MAPGLTESNKQEGENKVVAYDINVPYHAQSEEEKERMKSRTEFPDYLPSWEKVWFEELPEFDYQDPALRADKSMPNLLKSHVSRKEITPKMGSVLTGIKLEELSSAAKDELALLISQRKIVVLREQKAFLQTGPKFQQEFMSYYGKLNYQPVSGSIEGYPAFHIIHRDNKLDEAAFFRHKTSSTLWHQDVSYERQPPGYIMLGILACPEVGGDTVFANTAEAYERLSPHFQRFIDKLTAVHSSQKMIGFARETGGLVRKNAVQFEHPVVRLHPVTGERAIFLNGEFVTDLPGLKDGEAEVVQRFLVDHVQTGHDFQARVQWERHSVVMFDGRSTLHTATVDYDSTIQARHIFRLAAMTERPIPVRE